nr:aminopeptidase P family protein [Sphingomonas sp. Y57]
MNQPSDLGRRPDSDRSSRLGVKAIRAWLGRHGLAGLVIPSTDEHVSEFGPPANRRLKWATGFGGSTGVAIITARGGAIIVDSRYRAQAAEQCGSAGLDPVAATAEARLAWLGANLTRSDVLALLPALHSIIDFDLWQAQADELGLSLVERSVGEIDALWEHRPGPHNPVIVDYPLEFAGRASSDKIADAQRHVAAARLGALMVADPEDVSWLLNIRATGPEFVTDAGEWHVVPSCPSRLIIRSDGVVEWFVALDKVDVAVTARLRGAVTCFEAARFEERLRDAAGLGDIALNPRRTAASLRTMIAGQARVRSDDSISRGRWRKSAVEVDGARRAHIIDAVAVVRLMAWLRDEGGREAINELAVARELERLRRTSPAYLGASMPIMVASGVHGARPHQVPEPGRALLVGEHPLLWIDSGGQYRGGTTDNTLTVAVAPPEPRHVLAHSLVLKGYIALARARFPQGTRSFALDALARMPLWEHGMDYGHSTGHGVGNFLNIHEGPSIAKEPNATSDVLVRGMIVSNEPGYYADGDFGLRIESHMAVVDADSAGFLRFETISRLPIDPALIDWKLMSREEVQWLRSYHRSVWDDLSPLLDGSVKRYLQDFLAPYLELSAADPGKG